MKRNFLTDAFSLNMLKVFPSCALVQELDSYSFCAFLDLLSKEKNLINALRYSMSAKIINSFCGTQFQKNKIEIKVSKGDDIYVILTRARLDDGKEISDKEIDDLYRGGKIKFFRVILM